MKRTGPLLVLLGAAAGAGAKAADELGPRVLADLGTYPAVWVLVVALVARRSASWRRAALAAILFFAPMVVAYYGTALYGFRFPIDGAYALAWAVAAVTVCPLLAALLHLASVSRRAVAGVLPGAVAASVLVDGAVQRLLLAIAQPGLLEGARPAQAVADVAIAFLVALLLPRTPLARLVSLGVLVLLAPVLPAVLDRLVTGSGLIG